VSKSEKDIHPIAAEKREAVLDALSRIERDHGVVIIFACESGSRGWGFSSPDSDYDARFIYMHRREWYLTVNERTGPGQSQRDVIELPVDDDLDVSGWDLRKALRLLSKSNPTLSEWMRSPIVYREHPVIAEQLRTLSASFYSRVAAWHHYRSMAVASFRGYLRGERIRTKKYLYAIRPVLACQWIEQSDAPPPMAFENLLDRLLPSGNVREAIDRLLIVKRASKEIADGPRIPTISEFIEHEISRLELASPLLPGRSGSDAELDDFLRQVLME
jgi:predicted nucleotidyltransferase